MTENNGGTVCIRNDVATRKQFLVFQLALLTSLLLAIPSRLYPQFHPDLIDGLRGFLLAIAIGTFVTASLRHRRR
jgi:hypothetical protein